MNRFSIIITNNRTLEVLPVANMSTWLDAIICRDALQSNVPDGLSLTYGIISLDMA